MIKRNEWAKCEAKNMWKIIKLNSRFDRMEFVSILMARTATDWGSVGLVVLENVSFFGCLVAIQFIYFRCTIISAHICIYFIFGAYYIYKLTLIFHYMVYSLFIYIHSHSLRYSQLGYPIWRNDSRTIHLFERHWIAGSLKESPKRLPSRIAVFWEDPWEIGNRVATKSNQQKLKAKHLQPCSISLLSNYAG